MIQISELSVGMRVKIVDKWVAGSRHNPQGGMDCYLGSVVTVAEIHSNSWDRDISIEEDNGRWSWQPDMLDYVVEDSDFEPASLDELEALMFGVKKGS